MRLGEEKSLMILEAVVLVLVFLSAAFTAFCQGKLDERESAIHYSLLEVLKYQGVSQSWHQETLTTELHKFNFEVTGHEERYQHIPGKVKGLEDRHLSELVAQWQGGSLTLGEYLNRKAEYCAQRASRAAELHNLKNREHKELLEQVSPYKRLKLLSQFIHFSAIICSAIGYLWLATMINRRYSMRRSKG